MSFASADLRWKLTLAAVIREGVPTARRCLPSATALRSPLLSTASVPSSVHSHVPTASLPCADSQVAPAIELTNAVLLPVRGSCGSAYPGCEEMDSRSRPLLSLEVVRVPSGGGVTGRGRCRWPRGGAARAAAARARRSHRPATWRAGPFDGAGGREEIGTNDRQDEGGHELRLVASSPMQVTLVVVECGGAARG